MDEVKCPEVEQAVREHIAAIQAAQVALDAAMETACKVLEKVRQPFLDPVPAVASIADLRASTQVSDAEPSHAMDLTTLASDEFERAANPPQDESMAVLAAHDPIDVPHMPGVIDVPWTGDPGPVMPGEVYPMKEADELRPVNPVRGVIYEGGPDFNSGHTAVIRYE